MEFQKKELLRLRIAGHGIQRSAETDRLLTLAREIRDHLLEDEIAEYRSARSSESFLRTNSGCLRGLHRTLRMNPSKDSTEVIQFMALLQKFRDWIDDDPENLEQLAADDKSIARLYMDLNFAAMRLSISERRQRQLFVAPADPKFIEAWATMRRDTHQ